MPADLRLALRSLRRAPAFALATALTLALGLGATTALFTAVRGVLLRPLPYPRPEQLVELSEVAPDGHQMKATDPNLADWRRDARAFRGVAGYVDAPVTAFAGGEATRPQAAFVSRDFFAVVGVPPVVGRAFLPGEQRPGAPHAVVVSDAFWRRRLGASPALGRLTVALDGAPHQVVGVMPPGFDFPSGAELWVPGETAEPNTSRTSHHWLVVARLHDGVALAAARAELSTVTRALKRQFGGDMEAVNAAVVPLRDVVVGKARVPILLLFGAALVLLLVAAANVATLVLARAEARRREIGVRAAVGATRARLVGQFLTEVGVVAAAGAVAGLALAYAATRLAVRLAPASLPRTGEVRVDAGVLAFALLAAALVVAVLGGAAGLRATRGGAPVALGALGDWAGTAGRGAARARGALVGAQVALTAVLLVGAGLLARSFLGLTAVDPGFRTQGTVAVSVGFPWAQDSAADRRGRQLADAVVERLRALPGVRAAGAVSALPIAGEWGSNGAFVVQTRPDEVRTVEDFTRLSADPSRVGSAEYRRATEGYFEAMGIPLVVGRTFAAGDGIDAPPVAVISASVARACFAGESPLGRLIQFGNMDNDPRPLTVVGVVGDVREDGLDAEPQPTIYVLARQRPWGRPMTVVLAGAPGGPGLAAAPTAAAARRAVRAMDPALPVDARPIEAVFARALADRRYALGLAAAFGLAALALAVTGLYGVAAYVAAQRRRELGVRVALGARAADVRRLVLGRGLAPAAAGLLAGLAAALAGGRVLAAQLYGVRPADPATFAGVAAVLGAVAVAAAWAPARRAARADPTEALRAE